MAQILGNLFEPEPAPGLTGLLFEVRGIAEDAQGGVASVFEAHACGNVFGDLLVEMKLDFFV